MVIEGMMPALTHCPVIRILSFYCVMNSLETLQNEPASPGPTAFPALVSQRHNGLFELPQSLDISHRLGVHFSLLIALRAKHPPTAAHSLRVAQNLSAWGLYYQLPSEEIEQFELAGLLHDIGKIGIPERILQKPMPLLTEERAVVEMHPQVAKEILRSAGVHPEVIDAIDRLGSWFDGNNRAADTPPLPLVQRILSIADAFDAMTSAQTYRQALSTQEALDDLKRMSGSQFDPKLVDSFIEVVSNVNDELRRQVQLRWQDSGLSSSMVHLFQHHASADCDGSVAIHSLNQVFHRQMMDHMNDAVIFVDTELQLLEWNQAAERLTGLHRSAVLHSDWEPALIGLSDEQGRAIASENCPIVKAMRSGQSETWRFFLRQSDGRHLQVEAQLMPVFDHHGLLRGGAMLLGDASEQAGLEERVIELHTQATQDSLTKVANRAELNRKLPLFVGDAQTKKKSASVLICDIDYFKRVNDTFGHAAGDESLKVFASVLRDISRDTDLVARYGGEEFVILCHDCDLPSAIQIGENIRQRLLKTPVAALKGKRLTASYGVSEIEPTDAFEDALERADQALLQAKQTGRDRVVSLTSYQIMMSTENKNTDSLQKQITSSWLSWLGAGEVEPTLTADLISNVPREVAIEKLKGFVAECKAEVIEIQSNRVHLRVDCRNAPMARRDADRPTLFEMKVDLEVVDVAGNGRVDEIQTQTRLKMKIFASRQRDRRSEALLDQANRLKQSFQSFLLAHDIDSETRSRLIPVYKPGIDGR